MRFGFMIAFALPADDDDPADYVTVLELAGFDDAYFGLHRRGEIALALLREGDRFEDVVLEARQTVQRAIPTARWIGVISRNDL